MATISKGITLSYKIGEGAAVVLKDLQSIPDLGGDTESIEITTLDDAAHMYTEGIKSYGDSIEFGFLYKKEQFAQLAALTESAKWTITLPDDTKCSFSGKGSVKLDGVGVNAALTYTLAVKPESEMIFA